MGTVGGAALAIAGGAVIITGSLVPWYYQEGVSVAAIRLGDRSGALATTSDVFAALMIAAGVTALASVRSRPRFFHLWALALAPLLSLWLVEQYRGLDHDLWLYRVTFNPTDTTGMGPGIVLVLAGIGLAVLGALVSLRQAWRALRR